jgi:hypothetical protein
MNMSNPDPTRYDERGEFQPNEPEDQIWIYLQDPHYPENEELSVGYREKLEKQMGLKVGHADIFPGASGPGFFIVLPIEAYIIIGLSLQLFFKGKDIKDNLDAWTTMFSGLNAKFFKRPEKIVFTRNLAALQAIQLVLSLCVSPPDEVKLVGYRKRDERDLEEAREDWEPFADIEDPPDTEFLSVVTHDFCITVNGEMFLVSVDSSGRKTRLEMQ